MKIKPDSLDQETGVQCFTTLGGTLFAQNQTNFDDRNRVYQTLIFAVDPSTGTVGNALTGNNWFDPSGNLLQSIAPGDGKKFTKSSFNGVNWVTGTYTGFNTSGTSYSQATTVSGDIIVEQTVPTFNEVGAIVSSASFDRLNDADPTTTGALTSSNARISFTAAWFDGIDRTIANANYGAISSFTRPDTPPSSSSTVLVALTGYNSAGEAYQLTDPKGIVNQTNRDDAGRTTGTIEDVSGLARTTLFAWTLDNRPATMIAVNSATGNQTTTWVYGTNLATSGVARNDLLVSTIYPDSNTADAWSTLGVDDWANMTVDGWAGLPANPPDSTQITYNRLGQQATFTDQRGTVRSFVYDTLGRLTDDCVTTVGDDTDDAVLRISRAYEVRGMVQTITSFDNATVGSGTILNQVQFTCNSFGQIITDQQSHSGAVGSGTPAVGYTYDSGASGSNEIRLNELSYPDGRAIGYSHGSSGGMSDYLNRVDAINGTTSGTTTLASYTYLGAGTRNRDAARL